MSANILSEGSYIEQEYSNHARIHLTPIERRLLIFFMENPNRTITRAELLIRVWGADTDLQTRTVDVHIAHLRSKLDLRRNLIVQYKTGYLYKPCGKEKTERLLALLQMNAD